jgi:hypothetical protein
VWSDAIYKNRFVVRARLTPEQIQRFSTSMQEHLASGDIAFRKAYPWLIGRPSRRDREIRICGRKDVLEQLVTGGAKPAGVARSVGRRCVLDWLANQNKTANHYVLVVAM